MIRTITAASVALMLAASFGGAVAAQDAKTQQAVAALKAVIANPNVPIDPVLGEFTFNESLYVLDELNGTQHRQLARIVREYGIDFPSGIDTAIRLKGGRTSNNP